MRETLFRGKSTNNGEWVYGVPVIAKDGITDKDITVMVNNPNEIVPMEGLPLFEQVDPETVGQYTGLTDKNGNKIFEGDIIKIVPDCDYSDDYSISKVYPYNGIFCVDYHGDDFDSTALGFLEDYLPDGDFEVIGNIHDNPELMGGAQ